MCHKQKSVFPFYIWLMYYVTNVLKLHESVLPSVISLKKVISEVNPGWLVSKFSHKSVLKTWYKYAISRYTQQSRLSVSEELKKRLLSLMLSLTQVFLPVILDAFNFLSARSLTEEWRRVCMDPSTSPVFQHVTKPCMFEIALRLCMNILKKYFFKCWL